MTVGRECRRWPIIWSVVRRGFTKAAINIKDPFTLLAFFAVIVLIAFRTKSVPESLFKLVGEKISRERFYRLVHRAFLYVFAVFLVLCAVAAVGQVLEASHYRSRYSQTA